MECGGITFSEWGEFLMADYLTTDTELTSIANAIRTKGGTSASLTYPAGFVTAINNIPAGGTLISKSITANGTYNASSDNADGYSSVEVLVPSKGDLLVTEDLGTLNTSSTTATTVTTISVSGLSLYDALVVNCNVNTRVNSRHYGTTTLIWLNASSNRLNKDGNAIATAKQNIRAGANGTTNTVRSSTTAYGVYASSCSISNNTATITISVRYNGTQTGTINGTYTARIYGINLFST